MYVFYLFFFACFFILFWVELLDQKFQPHPCFHPKSYLVGTIRGHLLIFATDFLNLIKIKEKLKNQKKLRQFKEANLKLQLLDKLTHQKF